jgi:hypothetical protein
MMRNMMLNVLALMKAMMVIGGWKKSLNTWMGFADLLGPVRFSVSGRRKNACERTRHDASGCECRGQRTHAGPANVP